MRTTDRLWPSPRPSPASSRERGRARARLFVVVTVALILGCASFAHAAEPAKPRVVVLPLGGDASDRERERAAFAIRAKLDRQGIYEPIDGVTTTEPVGDRKIDLSTRPDDIRAIASDEKPDVIIWGVMNAGELRVNVLDLRDERPQPRVFAHPIAHATDVRFAVEKLIESLPASTKHAYVSEEAVTRDPEAERRWRDEPNLMKEGTFDQPGDWRGILAADKYAPQVVDREPKEDEVVIRKIEDGQHVLSMRLSKNTAETFGLACLSGPIAIEPNTRYRLSFRYRSDGPISRPFIKGYFIHDGAEREIYRRQVPKLGATGGKWVEVIDELNPQHQTFAVAFLRVDFYAYLTPGIVEYDDVVLKPVGAPTRAAKDAAIDQPVTPTTRER
jgi:hypothetical protein